MSKGFGNLMRQAQQMQKKMAKIQEELDGMSVEGEAGQGKVKAVMNGASELQSVSIDPELIDKDDPETMQDLLVLAVNDALAKVKKLKDEEMNKVTGGVNLNMPGMF